MRDDFQEYLDKQLKNKEFRREYEALEPEYIIMKAMIEARREEGLTQKELSERSGITQADISRLERGTGNPSLKTLQRVARALQMVLKIEFVPAQGSGTGRL